MADLENKDLELDQEENKPDYIDDINAWKKSHVPKDAYEKLKAENKKLMTSLMNGEQLETGKAPEKPNIEELKKKLTQPMSNMERWATSIALHDANADLGYNDYDILGDNEDDAQMVYEGMKYCLEVADGNPDIFNATLDRIMNDNPGPNKPIPKR
jgi:hypothetical protein